MTSGQLRNQPSKNNNDTSLYNDPLHHGTTKIEMAHSSHRIQYDSPSTHDVHSAHDDTPQPTNHTRATRQHVNTKGYTNVTCTNINNPSVFIHHIITSSHHHLKIFLVVSILHFATISTHHRHNRLEGGVKWSVQSLCCVTVLRVVEVLG